MAWNDPESYKKKLQTKILALLAQGPQRFIDVVRGCEGAYPAVVRECLEGLPECVYAPVSAYLVKSAAEDISEERSVLTSIEGNPVLCSWYFTAKACKRLELLRDWSRLRVAFLGAPRLYEWFAMHNQGKFRCLLDLDTFVLDRLGTLEETRSDVIQNYNVSDPLPEALKGKFDCVFFDPPWYPDEYPLWIMRAVQLAPNGLAHFSIFPELIRPTAWSERQQLFNLLKNYSDSFTLLSSFVDYDVPTFEDAQLRHAGIMNLGPWKSSDLVIAKLRIQTPITEPSPVVYFGAQWSEVDIGSMRIFVNTHLRFEKEAKLLSIPNTSSPILSSPSRRNPILKQINVLTSRGHGLNTSRPERLLDMLKGLRTVKDNGGQVTTSIDQIDMDPYSKNLLLEIIKEVENA
ncbi:MAG: hypothetical protein K0S45_4346 [Nitrospira sp.]|jgi:hypothetical protein|nr:hypothetical protein [Nitrospira sp.]